MHGVLFELCMCLLRTQPDRGGHKEAALRHSWDHSWQPTSLLLRPEPQPASGNFITLFALITQLGTTEA